MPSPQARPGAEDAAGAEAEAEPMTAEQRSSLGNTLQSIATRRRSSGSVVHAFGPSASFGAGSEVSEPGAAVRPLQYYGLGRSSSSVQRRIAESLQQAAAAVAELESPTEVAEAEEVGPETSMQAEEPPSQVATDVPAASEAQRQPGSDAAHVPALTAVEAEPAAPQADRRGEQRQSRESGASRAGSVRMAGQGDATPPMGQSPPTAAPPLPIAPPPQPTIPVAPGEQIEGYMLLPEDASLHPVQCGMVELVKVMRVMGMDLPPPPTVTILPVSSSPTSVLARTASNSTNPSTAATTPGSSQLVFQAPHEMGLGSGPASRVDRPMPPTVGHGPSLARISSGRVMRQPPAERHTQVVLPVAPDTTVPDWFFERTAAELKAAVADMARKRAAGEVLATRAWRERMAASGANGGGAGASGGAAVSLVATVRVRFPEGVCLQGCFGAWEPASAVFEWVTESLRYMGLDYELIMPSRAPLPCIGRIKDVQDLWPAAILNFRPLGTDDTACMMTNVPYLSDEMLALTHVE